MKKIKFAVIGCGHIGKRHASMIQQHEGAELIAIADTDAAKKSFADEAAVSFFSSADELIASGMEYDVANIATPNGFHAKQAMQFLHAGKNVVIEKPMALAKQDAENVIHTALQVNRYVFVVMQNRYSPPVAWLKEIVSKKIMGEIFFVQLNCFWNRDERYYKPGNWHGSKELDGGTLFTQFSHFIDIMYWLFGDIDHIHTRLFNFNHQSLTEFEDSGNISFHFINGGEGCLQFSTSVWQQNMESSITIIAENGTVKIGGQYMDKIEYCHIKDYVQPQLSPTNPGNDYGAYKGSAANHHLTIQNVIDVLNGKAPITTNALEGLKVVDIIERMYRAGSGS